MGLLMRTTLNRKASLTGFSAMRIPGDAYEYRVTQSGAAEVVNALATFTWSEVRIRA